MVALHAMLRFLKKKLPAFLLFFRSLPILRDRPLTQRQRIGQKAERCVAGHLRAEGYVILSRNFASRGGEIDIIAFRRGIVAFVEVRSLTGSAGMEAGRSVDYNKQRRIIYTARVYRARHMAGEDVFLRFDVAAVRLDDKGRVVDLEYFEDAFRAE